MVDNSSRQAHSGEVSYTSFRRALWRRSLVRQIDRKQEATQMATSSAPQSGSPGDVKPHRSWREIAKQASEEHDLNKALALAQELIHALDAESRKRMDRISPETKAEGAA